MRIVSIIKLLPIFLITFSFFGCYSEPATNNDEQEPAKLPSKLIAHRGLWNVPGSCQNSLASIRLACESETFLGAEIDVFETKDGVHILSHGEEINGMKIIETPFEQIRAFRLENGEQVPTLEEAIDLVAKYPDKKLMLDIKIGSAEIGPFIEKIKQSKHLDQLIFKSFGAWGCQRMSEAGLHPVYLLTWNINEINIEDCHRRGIDGISAYSQPILENPDIIQHFHDNDLDVLVWTLTEYSDIELFRDKGADLLIVDWVPDNASINNIKVGRTSTSIDYNEPHEVYNAEGQLVGGSLGEVSNGLYIIRQGNKTVKKLVK